VNSTAAMSPHPEDVSMALVVEVIARAVASATGRVTGKDDLNAREKEVFF
jgi:hypothetical protein